MASSVATAPSRPELDPDLLAKISPVTLAEHKVLPVPEAVRSLFPQGGLQQGSTLAVTGRGRWSLAMAVLAEALGDEGWVAMVGVPDLNLAAAAEFGVRLDRVLVVEDPGPGRWATVVATLLESVEVVAVAPTAPVGRRDLRRLSARTREQGGVLLHLDGARHWPEAPDLRLEVVTDTWQGLGDGHGVLAGRRVTVRADGRRIRGGGRSVSVWLPGPDGRLAPVSPAAAPAPAATPAPAAPAPLGLVTA